MQIEEFSKSVPKTKVEEKIVSRTIKEITPFGVRLELNLQGSVSGEIYTGQHLETVSLFQKNDGTFESESKAIESTKDGDLFVISYSGTGRQTGLTTLQAEGFGVIMTQSKKFSHLNNSRQRIAVTADIASGDVVVNSYTT